MKETKEARMGMIAVAAVMLVSVMRRLMGARRLSSGMMMLVVAGVVLLVAAGSASANGACIGATTVFGPGDTVTESCTFNESMTCTDDTMPGLYIGADDIVIDGNGFSMAGTRSAAACALPVIGGVASESIPVKHSGIVNGANMQSYDNVVIQNLEITNFCTGIVLGDGVFGDVDNNMVDGCCIYECGESTRLTHGIHMVGTNNCNIINNVIFGITGTGTTCSGGGNGIFMYGINADRGNYNTIDGNELHDNMKSGFFMKMMPQHNTISNNIATRNTQGGIVLRCMKSNYNVIEGNTVSENNALAGIYIGGKDNLIRYNTVINNNVCGINMGRSDGSYNNELYENTACGNKDVDIITCGSQCYGNHGDDNTCDTTSNYDDNGTTGCTFSCSPPEKPDLTITAKSETPTDSTLEVTYTVTNNGGGDAGASTTGIYVDGTEVATDPVGALEAGASRTGTVTIDPFNCPCGTTVTIKVCADKDGAVDESDETNNCRGNTFSCPGAAPACVADDGTAFFCGATVTKSCTLNGSMICSSGHGLIIGADNITIDGNNYMLDGVDPGICTWGDRSGICNKGHDDAVIKNLEIKSFCNGIYLDFSCRNTVENCDIHHNGNVTAPSATHGIKMRYVSNSTIQNNSIHDQIAYVDPNPGCEDGGNGLFLYQGEYNNVIENRLYKNQKAGMLIKMMPKYWNISHNHLWNNGQGGIILRCMLCNCNLIEHNNASDNYGSGIFIGGNDNTIRYNTVCNNRDGGHYYEDSIGGHGYGIHIGRSDGSLDNTLISNTVCENDYLDIMVVTGVTGNTGYENTCNTTYNYNDSGTTNCTYSCSTPQLLGDLNGDDKITPADAAIALQMAVRGEYSEDADVSGDHRVTSLDALLILQAADGV